MQLTAYSALMSSIEVIGWDGGCAITRGSVSTRAAPKHRGPPLGRVVADRTATREPPPSIGPASVHRGWGEGLIQSMPPKCREWQGQWFVSETKIDQYIAEGILSRRVAMLQWTPELQQLDCTSRVKVNQLHKGH